MHNAAFDTATDGTRKMGQRRWTSAAGQDKFFQWFEAVVKFGDQRFKAQDVRFADGAIAGNAEFAAEVKEVVLKSNTK